MGQTPPNQQPNTDTPPTPDPTPPPDGGKVFTEDYVKELRAEAANRRKELKDAQAALAQLKQAQEAADANKLAEQGEFKKLAEQESARRVELERQLEEQKSYLANERRTRQAMSAAAALGAIDPTDANFAQAAADVDISQPGYEAEIQKRLETLREKRPYLFQGHRPQTPLAQFNPAQQPPGSQRETDAQRRERIYGSGRSILDPDRAREHGGGAVIVKTPTKPE